MRFFTTKRCLFTAYRNCYYTFHIVLFVLDNCRVFDNRCGVGARPRGWLLLSLTLVLVSLTFLAKGHERWKEGDGSRDPGLHCESSQGMSQGVSGVLALVESSRYYYQI